MDEADINVFNRTPENASIPSPQQDDKERKVAATNERAASSDDSDYYDMSGTKFVLVFNHFKYDKRKRGETPLERTGTYKDVKRIKDVFGRLQFIVHCFQDQTHEQIISALRKFVAMDHKETSCIAVVVLTHGDKGGLLEARDEPYPVTEIYNLFIYSHNATLVTKPKLFLFQACRGGEVDEGFIVTDGTVNSDTLLLPKYVDFLTIFSTVPDHISWRDRNGSWLIQGLCDVIEENHDKLDLLHMITLMNRDIAYKRSSFTPKQPQYDNKKQMPETQFTLTKLLKFPRPVEQPITLDL